MVRNHDYRVRLPVIVALKDAKGVLVTDPDVIESMFLQHFRSIFRCDEGSSAIRIGEEDVSTGGILGEEEPPNLLATVKTRLSDEQKFVLDQPITADEIREAMFQFDGRKAPGPDGFVAAFYQDNWGWLVKDIVQSALTFFESGFMLKELNNTLITLIPKVPNPQCVGDFRPISLCNVLYLYKLLSKVLVNRLRAVLGDLVSQYQHGFVSSRLSSDNVLIAHEILEYVRKRKKGKHAYYALKLDMNKAYDRVNWDFLLGVLRVMGFSQKWLGWIRQCMSTVSFSVLVNGRRSRTFYPTCGIRQGDPLSPYLFILVAQVFSDGLEEFAWHNICRGIAVSSVSPRISHLVFADDCYIFMEFNEEHASCLKWILDVYCKQAGQKINFHKSELFTSPNMCARDVSKLKLIFGVKFVDKPGVYLGANMDFTMRKGSIFGRILERVGSKLASWKAPLLAFPSRLILAKHVLLTIPNYLFSELNQIKSVASHFLWGGEHGKGIVCRRWEVCCLPKSKGGLGLRDLGCLNQALLAKVAWRILKNPDSLIAKVLTGKYCQKQNLLEATVSSSSSWGWRSIMWGKELL